MFVGAISARSGMLRGRQLTMLPASTYLALSPGPLSSEGPFPLPRPTGRGYFGGSGFLGLRKNPEWP